MPEYNYFSAENIRVATEGLRESSANWFALASRMDGVSKVAELQTLEESAFMVLVDGPIGVAASRDLHQAYLHEFEKLTSHFREAKAQFEAMSTALRVNADWYEDADAESAQSFDGITQGDWPH
jgi:hypothetical protein